jgi:hypothetical protein
MYDHVKRYPWVLDLVNYDSQAMLVMDLNEKVIVPAEKNATQQTRK